MVGPAPGAGVAGRSAALLSKGLVSCLQLLLLTLQLLDPDGLLRVEPVHEGQTHVQAAVILLERRSAPQELLNLLLRARQVHSLLPPRRPPTRSAHALLHGPGTIHPLALALL